MSKKDQSKNQTTEFECHQNPYPKDTYAGGGISLPEFYRPLDSIHNNNLYFPGTETLPDGEMRVSFLGSSPWPPCVAQKGTSMLVELGNGTASPRRFFFDLGNGSVGHAVAMQVPVPEINNIFISHLHADHFADLPYMYPFRAYSGGFTPLHVYGPSGRTPELGIKEMIKNMRAMNRWHEEHFRACPVGDGLEIEAHEFDFRDVNGVCYDDGDVEVRHWPRSHVKDGASAYRLNWKSAGLSFVWTGDGRPDELTAKYGGPEYGGHVDVFVTEGTIDTPALSAFKVGAPAPIWEYTIDICHTPYYAAGYLFNQVKPRIGAICHFEWSGEAMAAESVAQIRCNWDGLFMFGMDLQVINVNKDFVWAREAVIGVDASPAQANVDSMPPVTFPRELQLEKKIIDSEIDYTLYYPPDVLREPTQRWPGEFDSSWLEENYNFAAPLQATPATPLDLLKARGVDPDALAKLKEKNRK